MENFKAVLSSVLLIVAEFLSLTMLQTISASPLGSLQNSIPSNKNFRGVVLMKNESVGPKMLFISSLIIGKKNGVSPSTV